ncbi:ExbD/TolR family protein [Breznakiella homolactica]|uniref:Biopolymer transporter ExbD n=1 Tax=Breznakiella homolactica TaxID=2798577 RepID=A0A7T8BA05_9SPIR|nr:biopolymer transporter ExbD [Breznakiella homolactica]QQO07728.1 biopolymer transporter ExbD [Breznakiella homolactica]
MKIKRRKTLSFGETSASSDVAFLLIIYFLVIAGFNVNFGFLMTLPAKDSTRMILKDDLMRFDMDGSGSLSYEDSRLSRTDAEKLIRSAVRAHPNLAVVLSVDSEAPWQEVVSFVELAQKLEIDAFSFSMKEES